MPCTPFTLPGGGRGLICSRSPRIRCACGQTATLQCDAPTARKGRTCSRHICVQCATETGPDLHLCPAHAPGGQAQKSLELIP